MIKIPSLFIILFWTGYAFAGGSVGGLPPATSEELLIDPEIVIDSESPFVIFDPEKSSLTINPKLTEVEMSSDEWKLAMASAVADETVPVRIKGVGLEVTTESIDVVNKRLYGKLESGERILVKPRLTMPVRSVRE